jgi:MFS family permease
MSIATRSLFMTALLAFMCVLSGTLLIPAVRPFMAWAAPGNESAAHAFMALNMLGAVLAAPVILKLTSKVSSPARLIAFLALADGLLLGSLTFGLPLHVLLVIRALQGAVNVGALSVLLGTAPTGEGAGRGSRYGVLGAAMTLGVAAGAPLGTLCLTFGARGPVFAGALLLFAVAALVPQLAIERVVPVPGTWRSVPVSPMAWVFAERFAIGLFVVTFSFHARACLDLPDSRIGLLLTAFLVPFALCVYPAGVLTDRWGSRLVAMLGLVAYGGAFLALPAVSARGMLALMLLLGWSSAAVFAAAMREAAKGASVAARIAAMSGLSSAGSMGMLLGTATAGIASSLLRAHGNSAETTHSFVFVVGGAAQFLVAALTFALAPLAPRLPHSIRS